MALMATLPRLRQRSWRRLAKSRAQAASALRRDTGAALACRPVSEPATLAVVQTPVILTGPFVASTAGVSRAFVGAGFARFDGLRPESCLQAAQVLARWLVAISIPASSAARAA